MIEFWVGVDGGGTLTRARIRDKGGRVLGEGRAAGSNLELGIEVAHANVLAAIEQARLEAGLPRESEQQMGVGLALASSPAQGPPGSSTAMVSCIAAQDAASPSRISAAAPGSGCAPSSNPCSATTASCPPAPWRCA